MPDAPAAPKVPRCGDCGYFHSTRMDPAKGVEVGECAYGTWPPVRPSSSSCPAFVPAGQLAQTRGKKPGPSRGSTPRRSQPERPAEPRRAPVEIDVDMDEATFRAVLREVITEELGLSDTPIGERWRGGEMVLKPGREGLQEKRLPIETFFHKVVMLRDRLRVLEQKLNSSALPDDEKVTLQQYITNVYGSLTTFNVLFRDEADRFVGSGGKE